MEIRKTFEKKLCMSELRLTHARYEREHHCDSHLHLMCRECGALYHVDCDLVGTLVSHIRDDHGFALDA